MVNEQEYSVTLNVWGAALILLGSINVSYLISMVFILPDFGADAFSLAVDLKNSGEELTQTDINDILNKFTEVNNIIIDSIKNLIVLYILPFGIFICNLISMFIARQNSIRTKIQLLKRRIKIINEYLTRMKLI